MPAWVSIILGLVGAFIGAAGAVGGQWLAARKQDARESRQRQFQAGADLLSAAYGFMGSASGLQTLLATPELTGEAHTAYQRYLARWDAYVDRFGVARLAAHPEVVQAARRLESSLYELSEATERWYVAHLRNTVRSSHSSQCEAALIDAAERRRDYVRSFRGCFPEYGIDRT